MSVVKECADIQTSDMLKLPVPEAEYINIVIKPSEEQKELVKSFAERAERIRKGGVDPSDDNMLAVTNDGKKCALDQRLINPILPDAKESKVNHCVQDVQGLAYTDKKQAGIALMAACTGLASSKNEEMIASFHGFNLSAYFESFSQKFILTVCRRCSYSMEMGSDPLGNIQRITNLMTGVEKNLSEAKQKLESVKQQFATAQKEVLKPFAKEGELKEKTARLAELDALLNLDDKGITEVLDTENNGQKDEETKENEELIFDKNSQEVSDKDKKEEPISEANRMRQGEPNRKDEKAEIPRRESETVKAFDGTITASDENKEISVETMEPMLENQTAHDGHRLLTLNDLKQIQREYADRRMARQNLNRQNSVKRDGYSR